MVNTDDTATKTAKKISVTAVSSAVYELDPPFVAGKETHSRVIVSQDINGAIVWPVFGPVRVLARADRPDHKNGLAVLGYEVTMDTELDFDRLNSIPVISLNGDTARTRRTDPPQSHAAGDLSQFTLTDLRKRVLILVRENPMVIGTELNDLYRDTFKRRDWKRVSFDSPRKRAGELADEGYLIPQPVRDGGRQYLISEAGLAVIA